MSVGCLSSCYQRTHIFESPDNKDDSTLRAVVSCLPIIGLAMVFFNVHRSQKVLENQPVQMKNERFTKYCKWGLISNVIALALLVFTHPLGLSSTIAALTISFTISIVITSSLILALGICL